MKYINHMTVAGEDERVQALRDRHGLAGYGAYWLIVERIAAQIRPESSSTSMTLSWKKWGLLLDIRPTSAEKIMKSMHKVGLISMICSTFDGKTMKSMDKAGLISTETNTDYATVDIPNILKYADEYTKRVGIKIVKTPDKLPTISGTPALPALLALPEQQNLIATTRENHSSQRPKVKRKRYSYPIIWDETEGTFKGVTQEMVNRWKQAYPAVDIIRKLRELDEWLIANPAKRKHNYPRFIVNALKRSQERGGR